MHTQYTLHLRRNVSEPSYALDRNSASPHCQPGDHGRELAPLPPAALPMGNFTNTRKSRAHPTVSHCSVSSRHHHLHLGLLPNSPKQVGPSSRPVPPQIRRKASSHHCCAPGTFPILPSSLPRGCLAEGATVQVGQAQASGDQRVSVGMGHSTFLGAM